MNPRITRFFLPAVALFAWCTLNASAQHDHKKHDHDHKHHGHDHKHHDHDHGHGNHDHGGGQMSPEEMKMMAAWMEHSTPGKHHGHLKFFEGKWKYTAKMYPAEGAPPMEIAGTVEAKLDMGGRFLVSHWQGPSPFTPEPFSGMEVLGYDNAKKQYVSTWIDNMTTSTATAIGTCNESGKVFTYDGGMYDPSKGAKTPTRTVITVVNDNKYTFKMYEKHADKKEHLHMDFTVTRAGG